MCRQTTALARMAPRHWAHTSRSSPTWQRSYWTVSAANCVWACFELTARLLVVFVCQTTTLRPKAPKHWAHTWRGSVTTLAVEGKFERGWIGGRHPQRRMGCCCCQGKGACSKARRGEAFAEARKGRCPKRMQAAVPSMKSRKGKRKKGKSSETSAGRRCACLMLMVFSASGP